MSGPEDAVGRGGVSSAILYREAARTARRWQTHALRTGFSAVLLGMVLAVIWAVVHVDRFGIDPARYGQLGRGLFVAFAAGQVILAMTVAPFSVARAVIEERDERTMDLLALTRLTPRQILGAKVTARVLTLLTVIVGTLPALGLVLSLGGVGVVEAVAVTVHALLTVGLLGLLGGFFALFTRSPVVATVASIGHAAAATLGMPLLYGFLVLDWRAFAHFSPLLGTTARDAWAFLPVLSYAPAMAVIFVLGARLFALRMGRAGLHRYFEPAVWSSRALAWLWGAIGVSAVLVLPAAVGAAWYSTLSASLPAWGRILAGGFGRGLVWVWCVAVLVGGTWLYLRVAMDLVMVVDDVLSGASARRRRAGAPRTPQVWRNPVAWRAVRPAAWKVVVPALATWLLVLLGVFQTGFWVIPGGLLGVGIVQVGAALVMALWIAAASIAEERRAGTMDVLLTTTLPTWRIVIGKVLGVAGPSGAMLVLAYPMILLGVPHLGLLWQAEGRPLWTLLPIAFLACGWVTALWLAVIALTLVLAARLRNPRAAHPVALGIVGLGLAGPPAVGAVLGEGGWAALPFRLLVPVFAAHPEPWEIAVSAVGLLVGAAGLLLWMALRMRRWSRHG